MSYILDAIRKSEQERGQGSIPSLQTVHSANLKYKEGSRPVWPYILILLLGINLTGLVYFFYNQNRQEEQDQQVVQAQSLPVQSSDTVAERNDSETSIGSASSRTIEPEPEEVKVLEQNDFQQPKPQPYNIESSEPVLSIEELPDRIRADVPDLIFNGHVYSSDPLQRSIIINGEMMEEGDYINSELRIDEILPRGAVFYLKGQRFAVNVTSGWNVR